MRVVGGEHRGRRLSAPAGRDTRPTADRVREAVFSILGPVGGEDVLDLFAGSGAMGIEALSRGAASAAFVDDDRRACACIRGNLDALGIADRGRVVCRDWRAALQAERAAGRFYGLCLIDPPYSVLPRIGEAIADALAPIVSPGARIVVEGPASSPLPTFGGLPVDDRTDRTYGSTRISVLRLAGAAG
ncbi:MAG: 16S rRNA (guanine(966)-N(2))-methyltransferase RsmD [Thermoleophilia bacterium]